MLEEQLGFDELLSRAWEAYRALNLEESEAAFAEAVERTPEDYRGHFGLSKTYARLRQYEKAVAEAERCIELAPERYEGLAARGALHFLVDELEQAQAKLERATELAPGEPEPLLALSQVRADQTEFEEAQAALDRAREVIEALPDEEERLHWSAMAWHVQAYGLLAQGDTKEAIEAAQEAIAMAEANPYAACLAYSNIGILEARGRRYDQAIEYLEHAFEMNPHFHRAGTALARILILRRRYSRAAEVMENVVQDMPDVDASARYAYGLALGKSGQREMGRDQLAQAVDQGLKGLELMSARWQLVWLSDVGRSVIFGLILAAVLGWVVLAKPSAQSLTFLAILALVLTLQRTLGRRLRR